MKQNVISEEVMNLGEVKDALRKIQDRDKELNFRAQKTLEYIDHAVTLSTADAKKLSVALEGLKVPLLRERHIQKLIGLLPSTPDEVKIVLQGFSITVNKDNLQKIADACKPFIKE